jgi:hypothetical protein
MLQLLRRDAAQIQKREAVSDMRHAGLTFRLVALFIGASAIASAQLVQTPTAPDTDAEARQRIRTLLAKVSPDDRQQTVATLSDMLTSYRNLLDDELIAAWRGDGRANLPEVIISLADARVASAIIEYSWRDQREATFNLAYAPMLGNLMASYSDSAKPFLRDLLGITGNPPDLSQAETEAVCRILIDMPDTGAWRQNGQQILRRYRMVALKLLSQDMHSNDSQKVSRAQFWLSAIAIYGGLPAAAPPQR